MSTSIIIGEVPDAVRDELAARADLSGRSLEEYIRDELIALTRRPSAAVWMARVRARKDALQHVEPKHGREDVGTAEGSGAPDHSVADSHPVANHSLANHSVAGNHPVASHRADRGSEPRASESPLAEARRDVG